MDPERSAVVLRLQLSPLAGLKITASLRLSVHASAFFPFPLEPILTAPPSLETSSHSLLAYIRSLWQGNRRGNLYFAGFRFNCVNSVVSRVYVKCIGGRTRQNCLR